MRTKNNFIISLAFLVSTAFAQTDTLTRFSELSIDTMGKIKFTISYFGTDFSGCVEQYKNGKWVKIMPLSSGPIKVQISMRSKPRPQPKTPAERKTATDYCVAKFHKGLNRYRIRSSKPYHAISDEIKLESKVSNDDGSLWVSGNKIFRDAAGYYEILGSDGNQLLKGEENTIDISSLPSGSYFLYTKTKTTPFTK